MNSQFLSLAKSDYVKGLVVAFLTVFVSAISQSISAGHLPTLAEIQADSLAGLSAAMAYLIKNFVSNSSGQILKHETDEKAAG